MAEQVNIDEFLAKLRMDEYGRIKEMIFEGWLHTPTKKEAIDCVIDEYFWEEAVRYGRDDIFSTLSSLYGRAREEGWKFNTEGDPDDR